MSDVKPIGERVAYLEGRVDEMSRTISALTERLARIEARKAPGPLTEGTQ